MRLGEAGAPERSGVRRTNQGRQAAACGIPATGWIIAIYVWAGQAVSLFA
jgi:hypothetical protein